MYEASVSDVDNAVGPRGQGVAVRHNEHGCSVVAEFDEAVDDTPLRLGVDLGRRLVAE